MNNKTTSDLFWINIFGESWVKDMFRHFPMTKTILGGWNSSARNLLKRQEFAKVIQLLFTYYYDIKPQLIIKYQPNLQINSDDLPEEISAFIARPLKFELEGNEINLAQDLIQAIEKISIERNVYFPSIDQTVLAQQDLIEFCCAFFTLLKHFKEKEAEKIIDISDYEFLELSLKNIEETDD